VEALTVAGVLAELLDRHREPPRDGTTNRHVDSHVEVREIVGWLESTVADHVALHAGSLREPIRVDKNRISTVLACERAALAAPNRADGLSGAVVLGRLVDLALHHHVMCGPLDPPEAYTVALDALHADGDAAMLQWLSSGHEWARTNLTVHAQNLVASFGELDARWWARCESRVELALADAAVVGAARLDVHLGGAGTGRPSVIIEVKSGAKRRDPLDDGRWYALLCAARDGVAPDAVLTLWTADATVHLERVVPATIESAARRAGDAVALLVELAAGRPPTTRPNPTCSWCPALASCGDGEQWVAGSPDPLDDLDGLGAQADLDGSDGFWDDEIRDA
jgi:hypothetical protein